MEQQTDLKITEIDGEATLNGAMFEERKASECPYEVTPLFGGDRLFLRRKVTNPKWPQTSDSFSFGDVKILRDWLIGAVDRKWTGVVSVDDGSAKKQIFMNDGVVVFCSSDSIDDRLGEILFRTGVIDVEELAKAAAQVTDGVKFGQVLMRQGSIGAEEVWAGLCSQVRWIFRSMFFQDRIYFETKSGPISINSSVILPEDSKTLVKDAASFGVMLREFTSSLRSSDQIEFVTDSKAVSVIHAGSFAGDIIDLLRNSRTVAEFVSSFRSAESYAQATLLEAVQLGYCHIAQRDGSAAKQELQEIVKLDQRGRISDKIDAYAALVSDLHKEFAAHHVPFPAQELISFVGRASIGRRLLVLRQDGHLSEMSYGSILGQYQENRTNFGLVDRELEALIQFLLQLTTDLLPGDAGQRMRTAYANMVL